MDSAPKEVVSYLDDVVDSLLSGADVDAIYFDYAKAFDKVDHKLMLKSPEFMAFLTS